MTVETFLLARIAEDEAALETGRRLGVPPIPGGSRIFSGIGNHPTVSETRLAAECEAKRRIVEAYTDMSSLGGNERLEQRLTLHWTMELLALPYADHPDYREEWRP